MATTKKQLKDLQKAELLLAKAFELFENGTRGIQWCVVYNQTENAFTNLNGKLNGFVEMLKDKQNV